MKLVIFDCDGTLVDSQHVIVEAMERAWRKLGLTPPTRARTLSIVGLSLVQAMEALGDGSAGFPAVELAEAYKGEFQQLRTDAAFHEPLFPGTREVLDALAARSDMLVGMATGKSQRGVRMVMGHHGLFDRFVTIQTADDAPSKPHPAMVHQACAEAGVSPKRAVVVGDTSFDMLMARSAGAGAIGVDWGYHPTADLHQSGAQRVLSSFDELLPALDEMWRG